MSTRIVIIVSPYFPPSTVAGVHRARHLAKHLPSAGWTPIVVCVDEAFHEERQDAELAALVPASVEIVKVSALPAHLCRPMGLGDISLRSWRSLRAAVFHLLETRDVGAVLITGSPYYPMLMAAEIKRRFNVPTVLDFQDPWVSAWGAAQPLLTKRGLSHALAVALEPRVVRAADFITSVSETQNKQIAVRYPLLNRARMAAIPIGGDPEDYDALRVSQMVETDAIHLDDDYFELSYVGTIWPPVLETTRTILKALRRISEEMPDLARRLRVNFIGTTAHPNNSNGFRVMPLAEAEGVAAYVREVPQRLPYLEALAVQARSNAILMLGSDEPHYTASKIFGALMSDRPYLSVFHEASSAHELLQRAGGGIALGFAGASNLPGLIAPIADAMITLVTQPDALDRADPAVYEEFTARAIAAQFAAIFDRLSYKNRVDA